MRGWLLGLALAGLVGLGGAHAQTFLGFRLLDFDGIFVRWGGTGAEPVTVSYAFVEQSVEFKDARNCTGMVPVDGLLSRSNIDVSTFRSEVAAAFQMWEQAANIRFVPAASGTKPGILIGAQRDPVAFAFADVAYAKGFPGPLRPIERSLICLNPARHWKVGFDGDLAVYDLRYTIAHEIGHAIGLDHPEPHGQIMSMRYHEDFRTLQAGDVSGAVRIYGPRRSRLQAASAPAHAQD
ncbi:MAG: matrixin family metalloprotease [Hyphomicrobiaceae bacterium]